MSKILKAIAIIICLHFFVGFTAKKVNADSSVEIQYGVGIDPKEILDDEKRSVNITYNTDLNSTVSWGISAGWLGDRGVGLSTGYGCARFGTELKPFSFMYVSNYFGPCYFHEAFGNISGKLQFQTSLGIGWRDPKTTNKVGLLWNHWSNGGIKRPNIGLDLVMLAMSFGI